jgi:hypothetical protein
MGFGWGDSEESYDRVYNNDNFEENKSSLGHEVIAQRREGSSASYLSQPPLSSPPQDSLHRKQ